METIMKRSVNIIVLLLSVVVFASSAFATGPGVQVCDDNSGGGWPLADTATTTANIPVQLGDISGDIIDLNVSVDISHTFAGDLDSDITSPDLATNVVLWDRPLAGACGVSDYDAEVDDESVNGEIALACNAGPPAISGDYNAASAPPGNALSLVDTEDPNGTWVLDITDNAFLDVGTLNEACIILEAAAVTFDKWVSTMSGCPDTLDSLTVNAGEDVYYCYTVTNSGSEEFLVNNGDITDDQGLDLSGLEGTYPAGSTTTIEIGPLVAGGLTLPVGVITNIADLTITGNTVDYPGTETLNTTETATLTINGPDVSISVSPGAIAEAAGTSTVTATLTTISPEDVIVNLGFTGTATEGDDFNATSNQIVVPGGNLTGSIDVTAIQDPIDENPNETITVSVTSVLYANDTSTPQNITITDDDAAPTVTLSVNNSLISETGGTADFTATLSNPSSSAVTVTLTESGTATGGGVDYTISTTSIVIAAGTLTGISTVTGVGDGDDEADETVILDITGVTNGTESGTQQQTTTLVDDDAAPTVALSVDTPTIAEDGIAMATFTATLTGSTQQTVTVDLGFGGDATGGGTDYTASGSQIVITPPATSGTVTVTSVVDTLDEGAGEDVTVSVTDVTNGTDASTPQTTTITDDDAAPTVTLAVDNANIPEDGSTIATFTATLNALSGLDVTVDLGFTGTATGGGVDYTASSNQIIVPAGSMSATATVTADQDLLDEAGETVIVDITSVTNGTESGVQQETTTITDDDATPDVNLTVDMPTIAENGGVATFTATLSAVSGQTVTVNLGYTGTATGGGTDYTASSTMITINPGSVSGSVTVTGVDDGDDETDETVVVDITSVTGANENGVQTQITSIIDDDAAPTVALSVDNAAIAENGAMATFTATLTGTTQQTVTVDLGFSGDATGGGTDYTASGSQIVITPPATSGTITITSVVDTLDEGAGEDVTVSVTGVTNGTDASTPQTTTITDDDAAPTVTLGVDNANIPEDGSTIATFTATLSALSGLDVTVNLGFTGTATGGGTDYTASSNQIVVPAGSMSATATVTADQDLLDEPGETVIVDITSVTNGTESGVQQETTTITDDDATPDVNLTVDMPTIAENGGVATFTATLTAVSGQNVTVNLGYTGTATGGGTDYTASSTMITINAGSISGSVTVTGQDDGDDEPNETVIVDITSVTGANENGTQQQTTTIVDDDAGPVVDLTVDNANIPEDGSTIATFTASLTGATSQTVTVDLGFTGTATGGGTDYTASGTQIVIVPPATMGTVTVTADQDLLDEDNETVIVDITSVTNGTENGVQQQTTTITDDDTPPDVTLAVDNANIPEDGTTSATFTATLSAISGLDVTVNLGFTGTATAIADYTSTTNSIVIPAGSMSGTSVVTSVQDPEDENDETVIVDITSVTNGNESGVQQATTTILDDDPEPVVTLFIDNANIDENGGSAQVTAVLNTVSGLDVTVDLAFSGTAVGGGQDYTATGASIVISAGDFFDSIDINSDDDILFEDNETVIVDVDSVTNGQEVGTQQVTTTIIDDDENLDSDGDGIINKDECPGEIFPCPDTDGDGVPDYLESAIYDTDGEFNTDEDNDQNVDNDSDGDGSDDGVECASPPDCPDADGDGIPDYLDVDNSGPGDSDGDGIDDDVECPSGWPCPDNDGDGIPDYMDLDSDDDGEDDATEGVADTDGDNIPDYLESNTQDTDADGNADFNDTDADGDGLDDDTECTVPLPAFAADCLDVDTDGDGIPDHLDLDGDGDGTPDDTDPDPLDPDNPVVGGDANDSDGDGVSDTVECPTGVRCPDSDGDNQPDYMDTDSDDDGIDDTTEGTTDTDADGLPDRIESNMQDTDADGNADNNDSDADGDGLTDNAECDIPGGTAPGDCVDVDEDEDGIPNHLDADSDGDGITDDVDADPLDDSNGTPGNNDSDGDGVTDNVECPEGVICPDTDGDKQPDYMDTDSDNDGIDDATEDAVGDTDADGIPDRLESNVQDTDADGSFDNDDTDADGDGITDDIECQDPPLSTDPVLCWDTDTDGDGIPNHLDRDGDGDGTTDDVDPDPLDPDNPVIGGNANDSDGDGISDTVECPNGVICPDADGDAQPDYMDTDSDNDGIDDATEGTDDDDGDGIPDRLESNVQDTDADGDPDHDDSDADGDGDSDDTECGTPPLDPALCVNVDQDGDGIPDHLDRDRDGDGEPDDTDADPDDPDVPLPGGSDNDSDGDGISDDTECPNGVLCPDADGDAQPDYMDLDSDNDGTSDEDEGVTDTDADGIPDRLERNTQDTDADGTADNDDTDSDGDGLTDAAECGTPPLDPAECVNVDTDGDGIPNHLDADSDGDGLTDDVDAMPLDDSNGTPGANDSDGDGVTDDTECPEGVVCPDADGDAQPDYMDTDSDNDGIDDATEDAVGDTDADGIPDRLESNTTDTDADGSADFDDTDSDGDGDSDDTECGTPPLDPALCVNVDQDGDGIPDHLDGDRDGDGEPDATDADPDDPDVPTLGGSGNDSDSDGIPDTTECPTGVVCVDSDGDAQPDYMDTDSDDDGIPDATEGDVDTDGDGTPDYLDLDSDDDGIPDSVEGAGDSDGDGTPDYIDNDSDNDGISDMDEGAGDSDGDGTPDYLDGDSDNDGIGDDIEGNVDTDNDGIPDYLDDDSDSDGILDSVEGGEDTDGDGLRNFQELDSDNDGIVDNIEGGENDEDGDGVKDFLDIDSDNDGIIDNIEAQTTAGYIAPSGDDVDGDGLDDSYDIEHGGTLLIPYDHDGDGIPDYLDDDTDNDTFTDFTEGRDLNDDGAPDVTPEDADDDGDGLDNAFDTIDGFGTGPFTPNPKWREPSDEACTDLKPIKETIDTAATKLRKRFGRLLNIRQTVAAGACQGEVTYSAKIRRQVLNSANTIKTEIDDLLAALPDLDDISCMAGTCVELDQVATKDALSSALRRLSRLARQQIRGTCTKDNDPRTRRNRRFIRKQFRAANNALPEYPDSVLQCM